MKTPAGWVLLLVLSLAAGLRAWAVYEYTQVHPLSEAPTIDEASYDAWGLELAAGDWMGEEVFFQEPLYPYFLGVLYRIVGHDLLVVRLLQAVLGVLTCWLVARLGRRLAGEWAGVIAGLLFACLPSAVLMPCLLLKPNLHMPLFCAFALVLTRPGPGGIMRWFAVGLTGALCALLRGNSLVLLPVLCLWSVLPQPRGLPSFVRCCSFLLGLALVLTPVAWRNHEVGGVWALTTSGAGTNLYGGNNLWNPNGVATELPWVRGIPAHEAADWRHEAERRSGVLLDPGDVSRYWILETARSVIHNPAAHTAILWNKLRATLGHYAVPDNHLLAWDERYLGALRLPLPGFGILAALGLAACLTALLQRSRRAVLWESEEAGMRCVLLLGLYLLTIVLTVTSMRARMPLAVLFAPLAAAWILSIYKKPSVLSILLACATGAFVAWPLFDEEERGRDLAERDYNLIVHELELGPPTEGTRARAQNLIASYPQTARFQILRAELQFREAERLRAEGDEVSALLEEIASVRTLDELTATPDLSARTRMSVHRLAGLIHTLRRDWPRAEDGFRRAREFDPESAVLAAAHAQALVGCAEGGRTAPERASIATEARVILEALDEEAMPQQMREDLMERIRAVGGAPTLLGG